jgi:hypothetical protein
MKNLLLILSFSVVCIQVYPQVAIPYDNDTLWVHPVDNSSGITWGADGLDITEGNGAESDRNGYANTQAIVAEIDTGAAYLCDTLTAYGYNDWYLPAKVELDSLYQNQSAIGGFNSSSTYWSSTENDLNYVYGQYFFDGSHNNNVSKYGFYRVRCVRRSEQFNTLTLSLDSITDATTNGTCDGEINITVAGGSGFYTYDWDDAETTEDRTGLCPGEYSLTVTDTISDYSVSDTFQVINQKPYALLSGDTLWVHPTDNSTGINWGAYGLDITSGNAAESDSNGFDNTQAILAEIDSGVAHLCDTLEAFGDTTWYLPARVELYALYQNKTLIGGFDPSY